MLGSGQHEQSQESCLFSSDPIQNFQQMRDHIMLLCEATITYPYISALRDCLMSRVSRAHVEISFHSHSKFKNQRGLHERNLIPQYESHKSNTNYLWNLISHISYAGFYQKLFSREPDNHMTSLPTKSSHSVSWWENLTVNTHQVLHKYSDKGGGGSPKIFEVISALRLSYCHMCGPVPYQLHAVFVSLCKAFHPHC